MFSVVLLVVASKWSGQDQLSASRVTTTDATQSDTAQSDTAQNSAEEPNGPTTDEFTPFSDLPLVQVVDLPVEAWDTLDLIGQDGPYPFSRDDSVFQNREGILPDKPRGYYREYTVITPNENDRGARRIVAGESGELFYTSDHYNSFSEIVF